MAQQWIGSVRSRGTLRVYFAEGARGSVWTTITSQALATFNQLSSRHHLGVRLETTTEAPTEDAGADVNVDTAASQISFSYGGEQVTTAFSATRLHGHTHLISRERSGIEKAFISLPATPQINTPRGLRAVGNGVKLVICVHELIHACGLSNSDHSSDDVFQAMPEVDPGTRDTQDRVRIVSRRSSRSMPPVMLGSTTVQRVRALWR